MLKRDVLPFLDDLKARKLTNRALAKVLHVSEAHLCRTLKLVGLQKDPIIEPPNKNKDLLAARKLARMHAAQSKLSIEQAAKQANCSTRTIYRLRAKC